MVKQIIIARKDLNMSPGKLAAQVSHASMAFLTAAIREGAKPVRKDQAPRCTVPGVETEHAADCERELSYYSCDLSIEKEVFEEWFAGAFTKVVLQARNRPQLLKAKTMAEESGMKEGKDFFLIRDHCRTELEPEEIGEDGIGRTLTCIGFRPMDSDEIENISKKYHMYM